LGRLAGFFQKIGVETKGDQLFHRTFDKLKGMAWLSIHLKYAPSAAEFPSVSRHGEGPKGLLNGHEFEGVDVDVGGKA
jgi:hypothetical protein